MAWPPPAPAGRRRRDRATSVQPGPPPMPCRRPPSEHTPPPPRHGGPSHPLGRGHRPPVEHPHEAREHQITGRGWVPAGGAGQAAPAAGSTGLLCLHPRWAGSRAPGPLSARAGATASACAGPCPPAGGGCLGPRVWGRVRAVPSPPPGGTLPMCLTTPLLGRGLPRIPPHQPPPSPIYVFVVLPINGSGAQVSEEPWDQPPPHCPSGACRDMGPQSPKAAGGPCSPPGAGSSPARGDLWRRPWPWLLSHGTGPTGGDPPGGPR